MRRARICLPKQENTIPQGVRAQFRKGRTQFHKVRTQFRKGRSQFPKGRMQLRVGARIFLRTLSQLRAPLAELCARPPRIVCAPCGIVCACLGTQVLARCLALSLHFKCVGSPFRTAKCVHPTFGTMEMYACKVGNVCTNTLHW